MAPGQFPIAYPRAITRARPAVVCNYFTLMRQCQTTAAAAIWFHEWVPNNIFTHLHLQVFMYCRGRLLPTSLNEIPRMILFGSQQQGVDCTFALLYFKEIELFIFVAKDSQQENAIDKHVIVNF